MLVELTGRRRRELLSASARHWRLLVVEAKALRFVRNIGGRERHDAFGFD